MPKQIHIILSRIRELTNPLPDSVISFGTCIRGYSSFSWSSQRAARIAAPQRSIQYRAKK